MSYELVAASIVGGVFSIIGIVLINNNWFKREKLKQDYAMKRFKTGKKYKLKEMEMPEKTQKGIFDKLKGIDANTIGTILDALQGDNDVDYDDLGGLLDSPVVQGLIKGLGKNKDRGGGEEEQGRFN